MVHAYLKCTNARLLAGMEDGDTPAARTWTVTSPWVGPIRLPRPSAHSHYPSVIHTYLIDNPLCQLLKYPASHDDSIEINDTCLFDLRVAPDGRFHGPISTPAVALLPIRNTRRLFGYLI